MNSRRVLGVVILPLLLTAACSTPAASPSATVSSGLATPAATPPPSTGPTASPIARIEGTFDIGGGRSLYLRCIGSGSPTILLEAGDDSTGADWHLVGGKLVDQTRTCVYDRSGLGQSSGATGCRQLDDLVDDLDALLDVAGVLGPYLLVGASGGGYIIAGFAARHPDEVAGMVFVETAKALSAALYPEVLPEIACDAPGNREHRDFFAVEHAAWDNRTELGDFPLTLMSNDYGDAAERDEATNVADQRGWFDLTSGVTRQVVVTSGHDIPTNEPDVVVDEILAVLSAARAS